MTVDIPVRCTCGSLRGAVREVSAAKGNRLVCYCDDCQSFAHYLGRADEILDGHGGTDIFQTTPARLELTDGADRLACMRLTDGGVLRWYARCCNTPIANTMSARRMPFVGIVHSFMDHEGAGRSRDVDLGPVVASIHARFATGDRSALDAHDRAPVTMMLRIAGMMLAGLIRGEHSPSPFFDDQTGEPSVRPHVLSDEERSRVVADRDAR